MVVYRIVYYEIVSTKYYLEIQDRRSQYHEATDQQYSLPQHEILLQFGC